METIFTPADVAALLRSRRTIHRFDPDQPVPAALIEAALEAAVQAPNHKRTAPWRFYVVGGQTRERLIDLNAAVVREQRGEAAANDKHRRWREVPAFLIVTCRRSDDALRSREDYAACACAVQNLMLSLWSAGIGTKWTTGAVTRDPRLFALIGAELEASVVALLHVGYPAETREVDRPSADAFTTWLV